MAVDAISVLGTAITAISFLEGLFPGQQKQGASVSIRTSNGYDMNTGDVGNPNTGGTIRGVYGYDSGNRLLGVSDNNVHIGAGDEHTFIIDQGNNVQALYIDVVADDDAVCLPVVSVTEPNEGNNYAWLGDVFQACGLENYYGNVDVDGKGYMPRCGWIDANHDNIGQASFKYYLPAFSVNHGDTDYSQDVDYYCHPRPLEVRYDAEPIEKRSEEEQTARRKQRRDSLVKVNELIVSPHDAHPASALCEDPTTVGPDFVSLSEKTFCDMGSKKWYSLCDEASGLLDNCFSLNIANKTMTAQFSHPRALGLLTSLFSYELVTGW